MLKKSPNYTIGLLLADLLFTLLALYLASLARLYLPYGKHLTSDYTSPPWVVYLMAVLVWMVVGAMLSLYIPRRPYTRLNEVWGIIRAALLSGLTFAGVLYMSYRDVPRLLFLYFMFLQLVFLACIRLALYAWARLRYGNSTGIRVLIVGAGKVGLELSQRIRSQGDTFELVGYLDDDPDKQEQSYEGVPVLGCTDQATRLVSERNVEEVIFALPLRAHKSLETLVKSLQAMPVRVRIIPDFFDLAYFRATIDDFGGIPLVGLRDPAIDGPNRVIKRLFDLTVAGVMLILSAPLMLLVAIAVRLDSPGPVLFRQQRVGENGQLFTIYKFRSMNADAETHQTEFLSMAEAGAVLFKRPDDPRVTHVGHFIRRWSLDELPQVFNVLKGDMSIVGPRPELPWLVDQYESWQRKRFAVPPGITGWWQINGRSDRPMHLHTDDDLYYIQNYSPLLDVRILWSTIWVVLRGKGAY